MKEKDSVFEIEGEVVLALRDARFLVKFAGGMELKCHVSGKIRQNYVSILPGDTVTVEISKYDIKKGRIVYRKKGR